MSTYVHVPWVPVQPVQVLQGIELNEDNEPMEKNFMGQLREAESIKAFPKQTMKQAMPFASFVMSKASQIHLGVRDQRDPDR